MTTILENTADVPGGKPVLPEKPEETRGLSQGQIVRKRFFGHTGAVVSIFVLAAVLVLSISAIGLGPIPGWWKYGYTETPALMNGGHPTLQLFPFSLGEHPFGQDRVGRDMFAMTLRGAQISLFVMIVVGAIAALVGVLIGASAGFFRGKTEAILMRFTDMVIIIPALIAAAVVAQAAKGPVLLAIFLGLVSWTGMARLVRGDFLSLREREFVDAARLAGASNSRIIFKHILPNAVGVITVNTTLLMSAAILTETALSYVGLGIQAPDTSLGKLISDNQAAFSTRPWLFWWPGLFIVVICLTINFIGDGLRDAFDPRQKKLNVRRVKESPDRPDAQGVPALVNNAPSGPSSALTSGLYQNLDQPADGGEGNEETHR
ncbi:ABC transporter permease [Cellulomonas edaphi]|uniref:ABC transporter permease n=1 Tax=Cellulomonas edaphi TaxID=3053468 RepID=A0ABT7S5D1_9CELL|nr:ABC transporter permease [Cellulomons edaphi]MDM7830796.1 ABC transporter permease [Cellulomons edaphi]